MTASSIQEKSSSQLHSSDGTVPQAPSNNIIDFEDPRDSSNPVNWAFSRKVSTSLLYSLTSLGSVWASTAYVFEDIMYDVLLSDNKLRTSQCQDIRAV